MTERELDAAVDFAEEQLVVDELLKYREFRKNLGVLSLTENPLNLLMWAHYGDEHRGVAVELDITHPGLLPHAAGGDSYSGLHKVRYQKQKVSGLPRPDQMLDVLSTKSPDWGYEREWRLIRTLNLLRKVNDAVFVCDIDLKAIKTVYLGARFPAERLEEIVPLARRNGGEHIRFLKVTMAPHRFELRTCAAEKFGWMLLHREHHFGAAAAEALDCLPMDTDT